VHAQEALTYQAFYDTLTGLPNRALFLDRLNQELARHRRDGSDVAVLFLDLDRFKIVNDSLGHETGDAVLKEVGNRFKHGVRAGETAARFSGDEFVFIIEDVDGVADAVAAAKRLQALLEPPVRGGDQDLTITGSIGIVIPNLGADAGTILRDADAAMYKAKDEGRNRYALFDETVRHRSVVRLAMEGELRQALSRNEFEVYYQPVVDPASGRPVGAEALLRWHHPTGGFVPPLEFIPVAEDSGLIKPVGRWVFEQAISQLALWDAESDGPHLDFLAINLSARQLDDSETPDIVREVLERYGTDPSRVCLEVTESVVMVDSAPTRRSLDAFQDLGLQVAIDDFGTGYSSLAYLHTLPVTTVKIDRSFVERLGGADDSTPVVKAVIDMSHAMGLSVLAEGVSSEHLGTRVSAMGCDAAQGFYWARPAPADEFAYWWRKARQPAAPRARI
jgi:diguanylate cyclase (GGDEF)-like protein